MDEFIFILNKVVMFVLLAIPGYLLVKTKCLKSSDSKGLTMLLLYIGLPCMILVSTLNIPITSKTIVDMLIISLIFVLGIFALLFFSNVFAKYEPLTDQRRMAKFCMLFANNGFLGIPLADAIFGVSNPIIVVFTGVLNVINNVLWPTMGNYMLTQDKKHISAKGLLTNLVFIAFVLGLVLNLLGLQTKVPEVMDYVKDYADFFKAIVAPLSMTIIGMKFADIKFIKLFTSKKVYFLSFVRLIFSPVLVVAVLFLIRTFSNISDEIIIATYISFAMPSAAVAPTLADKFNMDSENAVLYSLGTSLFSVMTIPVLYYLLILII